MSDVAGLDGSAVNHKELIRIGFLEGRNAVLLAKVGVDEVVGRAGIQKREGRYGRRGRGRSC